MTGELHESKGGSKEPCNSLLQRALDEAGLAVDDSDVTQDLVLSLSLGTKLVKLGIVVGELSDELLSAGDVGESRGDEGLG